MKRLVLKTLFLTALLAVCLHFMELLFNHFVPKDISVKRYWIFQKNETYDFAVLGSSKVENCIDVMTLQQKSGKKGINLGVGGIRYNECYIILNKFLAKNKVKELFVEVNVYAFDHRSTSAVFHPYYFIPYRNDSVIAPIIKNHITSEEWWRWELIPFAAYVEYNSLIGYSNILNLMRNRAPLFDSTGSHLLPAQPFAGINKDVDFGIEQREVAYLDLIVETARKHNLRIQFFTTPDYAYDFPHRATIQRFINEKAEGHKIPYFSFETWPLRSQQKYFRDYTHFNAEGALLFSSALADSLFK